MFLPPSVCKYTYGLYNDGYDKKKYIYPPKLHFNVCVSVISLNQCFLLLLTFKTDFRFSKICAKD